MLPARELASWMVLGQPLPVDTPSARRLAWHWVEATAVASRVVRGDSLLDRDLVTEVTWPRSRRLLALRYLGERIVVPPMEEDEVTRVYRTGDLRMLAHVLRGATVEAHPEERQRQREVALGIRRDLVQGGSWSDAVARSEDDESRSRNGLLGLVGRGDLDPALEAVAFRLRPGEVSGVVESPAGFHVLYRPRLEDVRPVFTRLLGERRAEEARTDHLRSLVEKSGLSLEEGWEGRARAVARDPWSALDDGRPVARHRGGWMADSVLARYLMGLPPENLASLAQAPAAALRDVVMDAASQELLWMEMHEAGVRLTDAEYAEVRGRYRQTLEELWAGLGLSPRTPREPARGDEEVGRRVAAYMEAVVARRTEMVPVPPYLAVHLLRGRSWGVSGAGIGAAVETARRLMAEAGGPP